MSTIHISAATVRRSLLLTIIGFILIACSGPIQALPTPLPERTMPLSPSVELTLEEVPVEQVEAYFQDTTSHQMLRSIDYFTQTGVRSLHRVARFGPSDDRLTSGPYIVLKPGEPLVGYFMLVDTLEFSHDFRIVPTLDYSSVRLRFDGHTEDFPSFSMEPGTKRAFRFNLPPLSEGLHTLVLTFLVDPDHHFRFDATTFDPRENEAMGLHDAPFEFGLLIWVTDTPPQSAYDWPQQARYVPPDKTALMMEAMLVKDVPPPGQPDLLFQNEDTLMAGQRAVYHLRVVAPEAKADTPLKVLVFWDDGLTQVDDLHISPETAQGDRYVPFEIHVPETLSSGEHMLTVIGYPYPYYLRVWMEDPAQWHAAPNPYSLPMARLPVHVIETDR